VEDSYSQWLHVRNVSTNVSVYSIFCGRLIFTVVTCLKFKRFKVVFAVDSYSHWLHVLKLRGFREVQKCILLLWKLWEAELLSNVPVSSFLLSFSLIPIYKHRKSDQTHQKGTRIVPILNNGPNSDHGPNFGPHCMLWISAGASVVKYNNKISTHTRRLFQFNIC